MSLEAGRFAAKILVATLFLFLFAGTAAAQQALTLGVGQSKTLELSAIADSVNLSRADVIDVTKGGNKASVVLHGKGLGTVDLTISLKDGRTVTYRITVADAEALGRKLEQVRRLLGSVNGVTVGIQGSQIVLSGRVQSRSVAQKIQAIKQQYPGLIIDGTDKALPEPNTIVQTINRVLGDNDIANIQAMAYGRLLVLEGSPKDENERELAVRIAKMIYPEIEDRISKISSGAPAINIEVMFVEVQNRNHKEIGFKNKDGVATSEDGKETYAAGSLQAPGVGGQSGKLRWTVGGLNAFLQMIQTKTSSRVLSNPQIIGRSGVEAEFHSGGKASFGFETVEDGKPVVYFKEIPYGVQLKVLPILDKIGQIDVKMETEVSDFSATPVKGSVVDTVLTKLKTAVTLKDGQSIMLSGLISKRNRKTVQKVPLLGDIPIVGELFKSRLTDDEDKELLILITMNRISGNDQSGDEATRLFDRARKDIEFSIFD